MTYRYSSCESDMSDMSDINVDYPDWKYRPGKKVSEEETKKAGLEAEFTEYEKRNLNLIGHLEWLEEDDWELKLLGRKKESVSQLNRDYQIIRKELGLLPNKKSTPPSLKDLCTERIRRYLLEACLAFLGGLPMTIPNIRRAFFQLERWGKIQVLGRWTHKLTYLVYSLCRYLPDSLVAPIHFDRELRDKPYLVTRFRRNMDEHLSNLPKYKEYSRVYIRCKTCNKLFDCSHSFPYRELPFCVDCLDSDGWYNPLLDKFADTC